MELNTVNVIEFDDKSMPASMKSFQDDKDGNVEAEALFTAILKENDPDISNEVIEESLDDGYWTNGGWSVVLIHST